MARIRVTCLPVIRSIRAEIAVRSPAPPTISRASASRSAATCWAWLIASPTSRRPHSESREAAVWSCGQQHADLSDRELRVAGVGQRLVHQRAGRLVDVGGHLPIEVGRQPVPHVGLDQRLAPGLRLGPGVEGFDRSHERRHRLLRVGAELGDPVDQLAVVADLQRRLLGQRGAQRGASAPSGRRGPSGRTRSARRRQARRAGRPRPPGRAGWSRSWPMLFLSRLVRCRRRRSRAADAVAATDAALRSRRRAATVARRPARRPAGSRPAGLGAG